VPGVLLLGLLTILDRQFLDSIPLDGLQDEAALDAAADTTSDPYGFGLAGGTSFETERTLDGMPVDGVVTPSVDTPLFDELVETIEVAPAAGTVHVTTRARRDRWGGTAFLHLDPWRAAPARVRDAQPIDARTELSHQAVIGVEAGGPLVAHRAWLWIAAAPWEESLTVVRDVRRRDNDALVDERRLPIRRMGAEVAARLDLELRDNQRGGLELVLEPYDDESINPYGNVDEQQLERTGILGDLGAHWTAASGTQTTFEAAAGIHRADARAGSRDGARDDDPLIQISGDLGDLEGISGCDDQCSVGNYATGGPGQLVDETEQRIWAHLGAIERLGAHAIAAHVDGDLRSQDFLRAYSGGFEQDDLGRTFRFLDPIWGHQHSNTITADVGDTWALSPSVVLDATVGHRMERIEAGRLQLGLFTWSAGATWTPPSRQPTALELHVARRGLAVPLSANWHVFSDQQDVIENPSDPNAAIPETLTPQIIDSGLVADQITSLDGGIARELSADLLVRASLLLTRLDHVVEDTFDGDSYHISNPPDAYRDHTALSIAVERWFARGTGVRATYIYARTRGTYPGLLDLDNGQVEPFFSSEFDLPELAANRDGALPRDRPHTLQLDGAVACDHLHAGAHLVARSGAPIDMLSREVTYGPGEAFLLPRGAAGRGPSTLDLDVRIGWAQSLSRGMSLDIFVDLLHATNAQTATAFDEQYTQSPAAPIVGGTAADLIWAKATADLAGTDASTPVVRNPDFGSPTSRLPPLALRLGARVTF
jgi:hypothetical protein